MSDVEFEFRSKRPAEDRLYLDFMSSRPGSGTQTARTPDEGGDPDRPLYLDRVGREPRRGKGRIGAVMGFAAALAVGALGALAVILAGRHDVRQAAGPAQDLEGQIAQAAAQNTSPPAAARPAPLDEPAPLPAPAAQIEKAPAPAPAPAAAPASPSEAEVAPPRPAPASHPHVARRASRPVAKHRPAHPAPVRAPKAHAAAKPPAKRPAASDLDLDALAKSLR